MYLDFPVGGAKSLRRSPVAYPELVSRGVSKTRKFKWLVKVGANIRPGAQDGYSCEEGQNV